MTDAELAILSLLYEKPCYDHELNKLIEARGLRRWTAIGSSSMYYVLEKLERQGLVRKVSEHDGRRLFEISAAGTGVLQTSVADLLGSPRTYDKSFELGLANINVLKSSQIYMALLSRQQDMEAQLTRIREIFDRDKDTMPFHAAAIYTHRLHMLESELYWLREFIATWKTQAPPDPEVSIEPAIIPRSRQVILPQDPDSIHKAQTQDVSPSRRPTPPSLPTQMIPLPPEKKDKPE